MNYDKGPQITVQQLMDYLKHIPSDTKICIGIGDKVAPLHYLLNRKGELLMHTDCYMQDAAETNLLTVLSFNKVKK